MEFHAEKPRPKGQAAVEDDKTVHENPRSITFGHTRGTCPIRLRESRSLTGQL